MGPRNHPAKGEATPNTTTIEDKTTTSSASSSSMYLSHDDHLIEKKSLNMMSLLPFTTRQANGVGGGPVTTPPRKLKVLKSVTAAGTDIIEQGFLLDTNATLSPRVTSYHTFPKEEVRSKEIKGRHPSKYGTLRYVVGPTSGKRGFYPPPLVPKLYGPGLKGALVPVRAAGARTAPSPGS
jgi:hypothetical protein